MSSAPLPSAAPPAEPPPPPIANPTYTPLPPPPPPARFRSFAAFYPFYLGEHAHRRNRILHLLGTALALLAFARAGVGLAALQVTKRTRVDGKMGMVLRAGSVGGFREAVRGVVAALAAAYALAWSGHFMVERNRPATFKYPVYSLMGDMRMLWEVVSGRRAL